MFDGESPLISGHRWSIPKHSDEFFRDQMKLSSIAELPVRLEHACEIVSLPKIHKDPFDRMLIAQSKIERMKLVTKDSKISLYDIEIVW
ncbi:MAG: PIN domain-containing protein [Bacteroidia bacterium]|nr:PIN domain-containing protein [Bacteroidia bacterium]